MGFISVIGSLNMDLVVRAQRMPLAGETLVGSDFRLIPGGKGCNQAVAARKAGANTQMIGCVGDDVFGKTLLENLNQIGVNTAGIQVKTGVSTGIATIVVEGNGDNRIIITPGANEFVTPTFILDQWSKINQSSFILLQHEIPLQTVYMIVEQAHADGIKVILNPSPIYSIEKDILSKIDVLVVNEIEASDLSGMQISDVDTAIAASNHIHGQGVETVIATLGGAGVVLVTSEGHHFQPAFPVDVVDTTAAGDTFVGAYAASLLERNNEMDALLFATAASGLAVTKLGAQPSIPFKKDVESFLKQYEH